MIDVPACGLSIFLGAAPRMIEVPACGSVLITGCPGIFVM